MEPSNERGEADRRLHEALPEAFSTTSQSQAVARTLITLTLSRHTSMEPGCDSEGDSDLYGLGVRTAVYISWFTTIIAFHGWPGHTVETLTVNCILKFSMLVGTIYKIMSNTAHTGEVFLMTVFGAGGGFAIMIETMVEKKATGFGTTKLAELLRIFLVLSYSTLGVWFWWHGRHVLLLASCDWRIFFFSSVSLHGWFPRFSQATSLLLLSANVVRLFFMALGIWANRHQIKPWLVYEGTLSAFPSTIGRTK
ncbi:hypothetical protein FCIRC_2642 [Fusarium circinatum]|uniref:Uncharacterized protein n=1 Tax=Fusarium circinatum TaxID=48490 RepID=A0A8H5UAK2_FUSCI|nr:hypothetical protein FCIRC_2642 [Fusarium circinatum]